MSNKQHKVFVKESVLPIPRCPYFIKRVWSIKEKETKGKESKKTNKVIIEKKSLINYESVFINKKGDEDNRIYFNFSLAFYRYAPDISENLSESKRAWLNTLVDNFNFSHEDIPEGHIYRWISDENNEDEIKNRIKNSVFSNGVEVEVFTMQTAQPFIVGLGEASPYETGITLDFLTGLPIIPGSAVKGITRRAAITKLSGNTDILPYGEEFEELAKEYEKCEEIIEVFGTQDQKGKVIFMDAYPINWNDNPDKKLFRLDVMNPHYGPYYENPAQNPPSDWYNPVPVFYLTVNTGVKYCFIVASKENSLLSKTKEWLEFALKNIGIGAKGSQGYGVFELA